METARLRFLYNRKTASAAGIMLAGMTVLTGCGAKQQTVYEPVRTALELHEDGTLTETIIDVLDESWYSSSELENMIADTVQTYNAQSGSDAVAYDGFTVENGQVQVQLNYAGGSDYASYNHMQFFTGSMLSAQMEGYLFNTSFYKVSSGVTSSDSISSDEPLSHKEYQVLIGDTSHEYHVPGRITYISSNAVTVDAYTAQAVQGDNENHAADETASGTEADSQQLIYILFEF